MDEYYLNAERANSEVLSLLPGEQQEKVFNQNLVDIGPEFLGFMNVYKALSLIIPRHFTVIDLGCAYNPQCFLFKDHRQYIAVDEDKKIKRFQSSNCKLYPMLISEFIEKHLQDFYLPETFAICSFVPPWHDDNMKLVRDNFVNVFTYYPSKK